MGRYGSYSDTGALDGTELLLAKKSGTKSVTTKRLAEFAARRGRRVAAIGDSITAYNIYTASDELSFIPNGPLSALQNYWGHRFVFDPLLNKGTGGDTTTQMLARYNADIAANYASFDWLFLHGGTNDVAAIASSAPTAFTNLRDMAIAATTAGKSVAWIAPWPRGVWSGGASSSDGRKALMRLRHLILDFCASTTLPIYCIDAWPDLVDPASSTSDPVTSPVRLLADLVHAASAGAFSRFARRASAVLSPFVPPRPYSNMGGGEVYDATLNPLGNLLTNPACLTATGGTVTNVGGTVPSSWIGVRRSGSFTTLEVVFSTSANAQGYDSDPGNKVIITCNIAGKTSSEIVGFRQSVSSNIAAGDRVYGTMRVRVTNVSNVKHLWLNAVESGTTSFKHGDGAAGIASNNFIYPEDQVWELRTPEFTVLAGNNSINLELQIAMDGTTAATVTAEVSRMMLRKVS